jgi:hypothetical protein
MGEDCEDCAMPEDRVSTAGVEQPKKLVTTKKKLIKGGRKR